MMQINDHDHDNNDHIHGNDDHDISVFNLILPCILITGIALMSFYMPSDSGEKVIILMTTDDWFDDDCYNDEENDWLCP